MESSKLLEACTSEDNLPTKRREDVDTVCLDPSRATQFRAMNSVPEGCAMETEAQEDSQGG